MKDPREYRTGVVWSLSHECSGIGNYKVYTILHDDVCARLDAKDAEIAALKANLTALRSALSLIDAALRREGGE